MTLINLPIFVELTADVLAEIAATVVELRKADGRG